MKTITQVANEMDVVRSTAYKYLVAMDQNGMLQYREGRISITELDKIMIELIDEALLRIPCSELLPEWYNYLKSL